MIYLLGRHRGRAENRGRVGGANTLNDDHGAEFDKTRIDSDGILLIPSKDFENDEHVKDFLMTVWKNYLFWWNLAGVKALTNIIGVQFWHSMCQKCIERFLKIVNIFFELKEQTEFTFTVLRDSINISNAYAALSARDLNCELG
ncbi:hypothetical protein Zmor_026165 [Zophobas morio]|uniref:Uncharacterized protein n=1 Tax=Zophobas morio TaxID=2755281 RepID=A0AA38HTK0_9CUCU|nr:hypothetical protein Zmor_026165 [Zophobas morio]